MIRCTYCSHKSVSAPDHDRNAGSYPHSRLPALHPTANDSTIECVTDLQRLLDRQDGIVSGRQLSAIGIPYSLVRSRTHNGRWQRLHRDVYATFSGAPTRHALVWAAILRCGPDAVASHETAAELHGLADRPEERVHVSVPAGRRVRGKLDGITVHHSRRLAQARHPVKTPPRTRLEETVLDLVHASRTPRTAVSWVVRAVQRRFTTTDRLAATLDRRKKIKWRRLIEGMLHDVAAGAHSMLELEHLYRVERAHCLPAGTRQRRVAGHRVIWVDVDHDEFATRIELDGRLGHVEDGIFRDRRRDNAGVVERTWTLRYGYAEICGDPCGVAAEEALVFMDRGWIGTPRKCGAACTIAEAMADLRRRRAA